MQKYIYPLLIIIALLSFSPRVTVAMTLPDPATSAVNYGDFYLYSLPILAYLYDQHSGGGVGPGNPYYVQSSPGHIKDGIVIATGASGNPVITNFPGMDDAYPTPNGAVITDFSTSTTPDPGFSPTMPANDPNTWDTTIAALMGQMNGATPFFYINNNQENSGGSANQNLWAFSQITLWSSQDLVSPLFYDFVSPNGDGTGVVGGDPLGYNSPTYGNPGWQPVPFEDYVLLHGAVCLDAGDSIVDCSDSSAVTGPLNHNLGENQAAYVIYAPEANDFLSAWDDSSPYDMLSMEYRMHSLNSGYEQVFVRPGETGPVLMPEPSTLLLMLFGVVGVLSLSRKKYPQTKT